MTEGEENIIIKGVLLEAISRDFSEELSNNKEVSVSPRFKRQMMAMMNNPNKWAERHKRDYRRRFVKVVATIVLTCSLPFGVLTVASPTVRAAVIDWVVLLGRILWEMIRWKQMRSTSIIISRRKDSPRMLSVGFLEI